MRCSKCGQENAEGNKFCYACGNALQTGEEQRVQEPFKVNGNGQPSYSEGDNHIDPGTGNILIKIFGVIFAILYVISLFRGGLYGIYLGLWGFFRGAGALYGIIKIISSVLVAASCALMCVMLLLMAFSKNKRDMESSMYGLIIAGILRAAVGVVVLLLSGILLILKPWFRVNVMGCFQTVLYVLITVGAMVLLAVLTGELKVGGRTADEIKLMVSMLPGIASDVFRSAQAKEPGVSQGGASTYYENDYKASQTPPQYNMQESASLKPAFRLKTDRSLAIYILLSICTCGIYSYYFLYSMARDANTICAGDGDKTGGLIAFILLNFITCGIYAIYWEYRLGNRLAENAPRYGLMFQENGTSVLLWHLFGALLCFIGPFIAMNILIKNMNRLSIVYNQYNGV